jgi:hypothetical protein
LRHGHIEKVAPQSIYKKTEQYNTQKIDGYEWQYLFSEKIPVDEPTVIQIENDHATDRQHGKVEVIHRHAAQIREQGGHGNEAAPYQKMQQEMQQTRAG